MCGRCEVLPTAGPLAITRCFTCDARAHLPGLTLGSFRICLNTCGFAYNTASINNHLYIKAILQVELAKPIHSYLELILQVKCNAKQRPRSLPISLLSIMRASALFLATACTSYVNPAAAFGTHYSVYSYRSCYDNTPHNSIT